MDLLEVPRQVLGLEAAGVVREIGPGVKDLAIGDRVIVMGGASLFTTKALVPSVNCWKFPTSLSFQQAATMPCVFMTVIYGLLEVGQMHSGQTILIHSACGGVGLAAIQVCRMLGATIYCTVSSEEKVKFLVEDIGIPRRHIFDSRSRSFLTDVMRVTNGAGVDLVLNSLSGDLLHASWECVAQFGKMIEIGKRDLIANGRISLNPFAENRSFHGIELAHLLNHRPNECRRLLVKMVELYEAGHIQPIFPIKNFQMAEAEQCFRYMQQGWHIGKVILSMESSASRPLTSQLSACWRPRWVRPNRGQLVSREWSATPDISFSICWRERIRQRLLQGPRKPRLHCHGCKGERRHCERRGEGYHSCDRSCTRCDESRHGVARHELSSNDPRIMECSE